MTAESNVVAFSPRTDSGVPRTAASTIEALLYELRSGLSCLEDDGAVGRLRRCFWESQRSLTDRWHEHCLYNDAHLLGQHSMTEAALAGGLLSLQRGCRGGEAQAPLTPRPWKTHHQPEGRGSFSRIERASLAADTAGMATMIKRLPTGFVISAQPVKASTPQVGTIIANVMGEQNVWNTGAFVLWNTGEPLLVAWLIERYFGSSFILDRVRNVFGLLAAAVVATAASGIGGMVASKLLHSATTPIWIIWQHWVASATIGIITVAPMVIGLAEVLREPPPRKEIIEGIGVVSELSVMTVIIVFLPSEPWQAVRPIGLLFPMLAWLAVRCRPPFAGR